MKPQHLTIRGLATFTEETVINFDDNGLFAIVGPTGSGKSSIIDALCFVLYGRVARLGGRTIEPLISVGAKEMAVSLTFTIRATTYRATRRVKRTKQGASTDEAALERLSPNHQMLASTADELTEVVVDLLGLTFDEFTKAVVLPQGEFATLLTATPKDRQNLLSSLLGAGLYEQIRQQATTEAKVAEAMANQLRVQVHQAGGLSVADLTGAESRVVTLERVAEEIDAAYVELEAAREAYAKANADTQFHKSLLDAIDQIGPPPQALIHHAETMADLVNQATKGEEERAEAQAALNALGDAPDTTEAKAAIAAHAQTEDLIQAHIAAEKNAKGWAPLVAEREAEIAPAQEALNRALVARDTTVRDNAAAQAAEGLAEGDDCPVCASTITADAPALGLEMDRHAIFVAQSNYDHAVRELEGIKLARKNALDLAERDQAKVDEAKRAIGVHEQTLKTLMARADAEAIIAKAEQYQSKWRALQTALVNAGKTADQLNARVKQEEKAADRFIHDLDRLRLGVAALNPPPTNGADVIGSWQALVAWSETQRPAVHQTWVAASQARDAHMNTGKALRAKVDQYLDDANVIDRQGEPPVAVATALTQARIKVEQIRAQLAQVEAWKADIDRQDERTAVYKAVAKHLGARAFPTWLLHETTVMLVHGASKHLNTLSDGQYRLAMDGNDIVVIDRANANLTRSVRTLSGGETFLASLALALALADYIHRVAASPVAIDSLFIDEGFGSLDGTALDQAAQALEQLGATDRMVGVITHVTELADRLPARIRVQRGASGSKIVSEYE